MSETLTHFHRSIRVRGGPRSPGSYEITFSFLGSLLWGRVGSTGWPGATGNPKHRDGPAPPCPRHQEEEGIVFEALSEAVSGFLLTFLTAPLTESFAQQVEGPLCLPSSPDSNVGSAK